MKIGDDIIDSRDIEERIEELETELEELTQALEDADGEDEVEEAELNLEVFDESSDGEELKNLRDFREEVGSSEWEYGLTLIKDSYFVTYAKELAYDIGAIEKDLPWPANHIDWDAAADALQYDYSSASIDGETYYYLDC